MGLIRGTLSCTRFLVSGELEEELREAVQARISRYAFQRLREDSDQERTVGWVNVLDEFQAGFSGVEYFKEPYLALGFRVDIRSVPARALRQYCREAEEEIKTREGLEFLNKKKREEIRDMVRSSLLRRAIPRSAVYDMAWDLQRGVVLFGSTSNRICDEFSETFYNTFDLRLTSVFPYGTAYRVLQEGKIGTDRLDELKPYALGEEVGS